MIKYKIMGRRKVANDSLGNDYVDVEWTREDGKPFEDWTMEPISHPPNIQYEKRSAGTREKILDTVIVPAGIPSSVVTAICEEKKARLLAALELDDE